MNFEELEEIKKRAEAATPGPWKFYPQDFDTKRYVQYSGLEGGNGECILGLVESDGNPEKYVIEGSRVDTVFLAQARQDVASLIAEVERLWVIRSAFVEEIERLSNLDWLTRELSDRS